MECCTAAVPAYKQSSGTLVSGHLPLPASSHLTIISTSSLGFVNNQSLAAHFGPSCCTTKQPQHIYTKTHGNSSTVTGDPSPYFPCDSWTSAQVSTVGADIYNLEPGTPIVIGSLSMHWVVLSCCPPHPLRTFWLCVPNYFDTTSSFSTLQLRCRDYLWSSTMFTSGQTTGSRCLQPWVFKGSVTLAIGGAVHSHGWATLALPRVLFYFIWFI